MKLCLVLGFCCVNLSVRGVVAETLPGDIVESSPYDRYSRSAYEVGRKEAERDVRDNRLVIESFGLPSGSQGEYEKLLNQKYHIQVRTVAGCVVDYQIFGHAKGYNEVSKAEIQRRFGNDVLENARAEADKRFMENHAK